MKYLIIISLIAVAELCTAQPKVLFAYDAAGNRVMRYQVSSLTLAGEGSEDANILENIAGLETKQEFLSGEINISPNPTTDIVMIEVTTNEAEPAQIFLYDGRARALRSAENVSYIKEFDISDLPAGTYYCRIETASKSGIWKVVKIR